MKNNYNKKTQKSSGGKRIGKSLEKKDSKSTGKGYPSKRDFKTNRSENPKKYRTEDERKMFSKNKSRSTNKVPKKQVYSEDIRLNRFIANAGVCSRREADTFISAGIVTINGKTITELGTKVKPGDDVRFDGRRLAAEKKVYVLLNKPKDFVTTTDDPHAEKTVMDLVKNACEERIYPVGRLDRNTTGVLLFTNDGDLSKKLTHPSHNMKKIYQVTLNNPLSKEHMLQIADGVDLEDGKIAADAISFINPENRTEIGIEIHSGKNRIVRRVFEHFGYRVKKLDRVLFAGLTKKNLPRGKWRLLTDKEIHFLKMN